MLKSVQLRQVTCLGLVIAILAGTCGPLPAAHAQEVYLPAPDKMVAASPAFSPAVLKGIKLDPKDPFRFHFFVDSGDSHFNQEELKVESSRLINYFLASLTTPEKDLWVNLSPYEKDRIVPPAFGQTGMGRDLLAQDYLLKQITASLIYPESQLGREFWQKVYAQAQAKFGTTDIPVNTFNKVWIMPEKAVVYENGGTAFVLENHLKVMLEQDYLALENHAAIGHDNAQAQDTNQLGSQIVRDVVIPALTREVNEGKNFARLRQVFYALILATWYKKKIKDSILNKVYSDQNKIGGVNVPAQDKEKIYQEYLKAFKEGVYNYIKEEPDPVTHLAVPRKYFSGGVVGSVMPDVIVYKTKLDAAQLDSLKAVRLTEITGDAALFANDALTREAGDDAQDADEAATKLSLTGIPRTTRIPLTFIANDPDAYQLLCSVAVGRAAATSLMGIGNAILSAGPVIKYKSYLLGLAGFSSWFFFKSNMSFMRVKRDTELFDRKFFVARILEAYLSHASSEAPKDEQKLFKRLRFLLIQKMISPRAFAIAANGDLIVYWKEPYVMKKLAPFIYPIPYWIAPLEGWRKRTMTVKGQGFDWKYFRTLRPVYIESDAGTRRGMRMDPGADQRMNGIADGAQKAGEAPGEPSLKGIPKTTRIPTAFVKNSLRLRNLFPPLGHCERGLYGIIVSI